MRLPEVKTFIDAHYEIAIVDVGRFDKNLQIPARWGITHRLEGVPSVLIIDPVSGKLLDQGHIAALADARSMTPQAIANWLALWPKSLSSQKKPMFFVANQPVSNKIEGPASDLRH